LISKEVIQNLISDYGQEFSSTIWTNSINQLISPLVKKFMKDEIFEIVQKAFQIYSHICSWYLMIDRSHDYQL
jgi:hypothetical protein